MIQVSLEQGAGYGVVGSELASGHSPEQVSALLARMHPDDTRIRVSHETIYRALYALPRGVPAPAAQAPSAAFARHRSPRADPQHDVDPPARPRGR